MGRFFLLCQRWTHTGATGAEAHARTSHSLFYKYLNWQRRFSKSHWVILIDNTQHHCHHTQSLCPLDIVQYCSRPIQTCTILIGAQKVLFKSALGAHWPPGWPTIVVSAVSMILHNTSFWPNSILYYPRGTRSLIWLIGNIYLTKYIAWKANFMKQLDIYYTESVLQTQQGTK